MMLNVNDFIGDYLCELGENTAVIEKGIVLLKREPQNNEELNKVERALHTIKGASRMLNFANIEKISHGMESIYKGIREKRYCINELFIRLTFMATDYLRAGIRQIKAEMNDHLPVDRLLGFLDKVSTGVTLEPADLEELRPGDGAAGTPGLVTGSALNAGTTHSKASDPGQEYNTVRIKTNTIDNLVKTLNNLITREFQLKKEKDTIEELETAINQFAGTAFLAGNRGAELKKYRETCLKLVQDLKKDFLEKMELVEIATFDAREQIFALRMLPLGLILDSLTKMAEETALNLGKEVELQITGSDVMLDKMILEKINDPLIHIIRNSIDHGIEEPAAREKKGKARAGKIEIHCYAETGNIIIRVKDDGRGLDYDLIRSKAILFAPGQENEIGKMSNEELHTFLFMPGFSTKKNITALSGRGMGLDIAGHNIEKIKGKISVKSTADKGTEFILALPLSLATVEGFFVSTAGEIFLVPAIFTRELLIIKQEDIFDLLHKMVIKVREKIIPVYYLSAIIGKEPGNRAATHYVLIVESLGEPAGIIVDTIIQYTSLIYKPLPRCLSGLKAVQGIVFNESFHIINILHIPEIINKCRHLGSSYVIQQVTDKQTALKHILVVDDSYSTREIEKSILETENYAVTTAVDGVDALDKIRSNSFQLIITDISMPRMDGLLLLKNVKQDTRYKTTPVIVISSEEDVNIRQQFLNAGANSFIIKMQFDRNNLVTAVRQLIG